MVVGERRRGQDRRDHQDSGRDRQDADRLGSSASRRVQGAHHGHLQLGVVVEHSEHHLPLRTSAMFTTSAPTGSDLAPIVIPAAKASSLRSFPGVTGVGTYPPRMVRTDATEKVWTAKQLRHFLTSVEDDRLATLWRLLGLTGLRRSEALGLKWEDVDWDGERVLIRRTLILVDGQPKFSQPKTDAARRPVELDPGTLAALRTHRIRQHKERLACGEGYEDLNLVFSREDGVPLRPDFVTRHFQQLAHDADLPPIGVTWVEAHPCHGTVGSRHPSQNRASEVGAHFSPRHPRYLQLSTAGDAG